jgi:UDP-N-acetylmuramyl pentapeptide phosphotransferase/UDP-N-acetylglucosamine-1-phosphate transferase
MADQENPYKSTSNLITSFWVSAQNQVETCPTHFLKSEAKKLDLNPLAAWGIAFCGFFSSALATPLFGTISIRGAIGTDRATGVQKVHVSPTSRLGGLAIFSSFATCSLLLKESQGWILIICAIPVFLGGLIEDISHRVSPNIRLLLAILSAVAGLQWLGTGVHHTDVWIVDRLLELPGAVFLLTILVVAGFTHGLNIVDGFHGLAAGSAMLMITSFLLMAWQAGDVFLVQLCGLSIACIAGFLLHNWPRGGIFLGDGGAYLLGFWVVELGLMLVIRNTEISPMAPTLVGIFPLTETLFSMYRRKFLRNHPVNHADALHLHTLVYRRLVTSPERPRTRELKNRANSKVSWYFWLPVAVFGTLAVIFQADTKMLLTLMLVYLLSYLWLYRRLVRFRAPAWLQF